MGLRKPLGLPQSSVTGTPGINPSAPSPTQLPGPQLPAPNLTAGSATGQPVRPTAPAPIGPDDLSDLRSDPISNLRLGIGDAASKVLGTQGPTERIMQQRQQQLETRQKSFQVNLAILGAAANYLDNIPLSQREKALEQLKGEFAGIAGPGSEELAEAILGDGSVAPGLIASLAEDEGAKALLANPATSVADLVAYSKDPATIQRALDRTDQKLVPEVEKRIQRLLSGARETNPDLLQKIQKDGKVTVEELKQLNEASTDGPEGSRLTPALLGVLERRQDVFAQRIEGFQTTDEFKTDREIDRALDVKRRESKIDLELAIGKEAAEAAFAAGGKSSAGAKKRDEEFAKEVYVPFVTDGGFTDAEKGLEQLDNVIRRLESGESASGRLQGRLPDAVQPEGAIDIRDTVEEIVQRNLRLILGAQFTEREGQRLIERSYNPKISEQANLVRLRRLREQMARSLQAKRSASDYFEKNGTLEGFEGQFRGEQTQTRAKTITPEQAFAELMRRKSSSVQP